MSERISHEDALSAVDVVLATIGETGSTKRLTRYIAQQQALEADTVSRADHEAALAAEHKVHDASEHHLHNCQMAAESEAKSLKAQLTALQAEHERTLATERARAEEAERAWKEAERECRHLCDVIEKRQAELAAANARAGRLEETRHDLRNALGNLVEAMKVSGSQPPPTVFKAFKEAERALALPIAPQASTEQVDKSKFTHVCMKCGGLNMGRCPVHDATAAAPTEQASPSPAVGEHVFPDSRAEWRFCSRCGVSWDTRSDLSCVAQPAPGGTERCAMVCQWGGQYIRCGKRAGHDMGHDYSGAPEPLPTPAEPQGRPEQAGDRVDRLRADVVEALRASAEQPLVFGAMLRFLADRLEGK